MKEYAWFQVEVVVPTSSQEDRQRLFQPFVQGEQARSSTGAGLGLSIIRRMDAHKLVMLSLMIELKRIINSANFPLKKSVKMRMISPL